MNKWEYAESIESSSIVNIEKKNMESSLMENFKMLIPKSLSKLYLLQQKKFYPQFL